MMNRHNLEINRKKAMRFSLRLVIAMTAAAGITLTPLPARAQSPSNQTKPKNIILLIGDGWGFNHLEAADDYQFGEPGAQRFEKEFQPLAMSTFPFGSSYDPQAAWNDFQYLREGVTDSAAAATALATGHKTRNGIIGMDPDKNPMENAVEKAEKSGKATGVVTSVPLSHATPAAFGAHNRGRGNLAEIAQDMFLKSRLDVIMGAGHPWFDDAGKPTADLSANAFPEGIDEKEYRYVGGSDLWRQLIAGAAGGDADGDGAPDPWFLVQSREEFTKLMSGDTPKRVAGIFQNSDTLQCYRPSVSGKPEDDAAGQSPRLENVPTLAEMAQAALNVVDQDPDGFFLMIEGGAIDWASSHKMFGRMIEETIDYCAAIDAVLAWIEKNSRWQETLVVITADHETGYLNGPGSDPAWNPIQNNGKGNMPGANWYGGHTRNLVPLFVKGPGSDTFIQAAVGKDPKRGPYLDNADTGRIIGDLLSKDPPLSAPNL